MPILNNYPLTEDPAGDYQGPELFKQLNCMGLPPDQNRILQELGGLYLGCTFNIGHPVSDYTRFLK